MKSSLLAAVRYMRYESGRRRPLYPCMSPRFNTCKVRMEVYVLRLHAVDAFLVKKVRWICDVNECLL